MHFFFMKTINDTCCQLWRLTDRRQTSMLLAPTHEEEITSLVANDVLSERGLPVRLFQIGLYLTEIKCNTCCSRKSLRAQISG